MINATIKRCYVLSDSYILLYLENDWHVYAFRIYNQTWPDLYRLFGFDFPENRLEMHQELSQFHGIDVELTLNKMRYIGTFGRAGTELQPFVARHAKGNSLRGIIKQIDIHKRLITILHGKPKTFALNDKQISTLCNVMNVTSYEELIEKIIYFIPFNQKTILAFQPDMMISKLIK